VLPRKKENHDFFLKTQWQPVLILAAVFSYTESLSEKGNVENSGKHISVVYVVKFLG